MSTTQYQRLPHSDDEDNNDSTQTQSTSRPSPRRVTDPRFNPPPPSAWKRIALIAFVVFLFWLSYSLSSKKNTQPKVIYASRYSKEFKYRPAASPIITERLKDGRVRLRGAYPMS
ncbi:hypothetical protein BKA82DRAFT_4190327 [Pisolithus tinctorius]|nr:hypothetical protein BKA82DRAFT_4190327 [Pisolithus tinctorius]